MSQKSKRVKKNSHPHPYGQGGAKQMSSDIQVSGKIEVSRAPSLTNEHDTERKEDATQESKRYFVERITFGVLIIYAGLTCWIAIEANRSAKAAVCAADAAQRQAKTSADQLVISERPWISSEVEIASPFTFDMNGANLNLTVRLRNSGLTPATQVGVVAKFVPPVIDSDKVRDIKRVVCDAAINNGHSSEVTIFPATEVRETRKFYAPPKQIAELTQGGTVSMSIAVCIAYKSVVDQNPQYTSEGQIFAFARKGPFGGTFAFIPGQNVPIGGLIFEARGQNQLLVVAGNYQIVPSDPSDVPVDATEGPVNVFLPRLGQDKRQK